MRVNLGCRPDGRGKRWLEMDSVDLGYPRRVAAVDAYDPDGRWLGRMEVEAYSHPEAIRRAAEKLGLTGSVNYWVSWKQVWDLDVLLTVGRV